MHFKNYNRLVRFELIIWLLVQIAGIPSEYGGQPVEVLGTSIAAGREYMSGRRTHIGIKQPWQR
jgi:hypothetical protein